MERHTTLKWEIRKETKLTFHNVMTGPILLYRRDTWDKTNKNVSKIQALNMKFWRNVKTYTTFTQN